MLPIQYILIAFFLLAFIKVIRRFRNEEATLVSTAGWLFFWVIAGAVVLLPDSTFFLARLVGVARGADLVVYAALVLLFFIVFRNMVAHEKLQRDVTLLTRKLSLAEKDK
ncbi:MAG: hypothetical protein A3I29_04705 [Candidatus Magasanikbacteria bacterium RIFCSPLOWO2_02_FULL_44_11]|uniref:DUF2304 domain-containing protein n=2 Tax=Candidatus Magasanikiibacteriota TaxID=1752731 RepID=A0A1F6N974_9BACT|nr:MAG: hypothetical protein A3D53_00475 [Candidatus Magasanikbacteria bacterium RIFCSPHIGHO2_02_FULL_45_10]OGH80308.1 MAG: hypothetical protein A3I29_04705 [Candidatus Magasanikbacteria bacterium RIFCSPLOWO2_02_FULL_44_11]